MTQTNRQLSNIYIVWGLILIVWALYRGFIHEPEWIDEFIVKPIVFVLPVLLFVFLREKRTITTIGLKSEQLQRDIKLGGIFALLFGGLGIVTNLVKYGTISLQPVIGLSVSVLLLNLFISFATAFSEEVLVRGFLYTRILEATHSQGKALMQSILMYVLLYIPIVFTRASLSFASFGIVVITGIILSVANTMIMTETKSLTVPILVHAFWNMAVVLYL